MRKLLLIIVFFTFYSVNAQNVTGYWYGQANVEMEGIQNNYLTELIIAQKGTKVRGFFGYYFKDVYESFVVKGTYNPQTREVVIKDIPIIYFNTNSTANSVDCITSFYGKLLVSKVKTTLTGYFYRDKKYTYTCPDLRVNYTLYTEAKVDDSVFKDMAATKTFWKPHPDQYAADASTETAGKKEDKGNSAVENVADNKKETAAKAEITADNKDPDKKDSAAKVGTMADNNKATGQSEAITKVENATDHNRDNNKKNTVAQEAGEDNKIAPRVAVSTSLASTAPHIQADIIKINDQFKKRKQVVGKEITVASDSIRLSFYDNAEVDGDSISVFLNGQLVIAHQELTERAFNVYIKLDSLKEINEVSMFAENLGKYPPNTALMVVSDGDQRYEIFMSSDFKGNATVRFKRRKSN